MKAEATLQHAFTQNEPSGTKQWSVQSSVATKPHWHAAPWDSGGIYKNNIAPNETKSRL